MTSRRITYMVSLFRAHAKGGVFAIILALFAACASVVTIPQTAQAQLGAGAGLGASYGANTSSCAIETVGWVICPVMRSIAKLADFGFAFINQNFLKIEYNIQANDGGVYKAWELMRNVANASFVLAFMAIVYAQITGKSAGGYNIKRMLPKLIIGALFVNLSYFVCVIFIDLSNVIGDSILFIMKQTAEQIGTAAMTLDSAENGFSDSRLSDIMSAVLTKTGTVWILLAPAAAVTISIAVVTGAGLVLLIMRKVVIAMLVLASPLIFVAYLLPNLERYFQQWMRLFGQLLILYPILAFLLGTGQIISATIVNMDSGGDTNYSVRDDSYSGRNGGSGHITTDLAAAGAAVLPLLGAWFLLKNITSFAGTAGGRLASIRRGSTKEQDAKMKAKLDSKQQQLPGAGGLPTYDRRPAFSRLSRRRKASSGNSTRQPEPARGEKGLSEPGRVGSNAGLPQFAMADALGGGNTQNNSDIENKNMNDINQQLTSNNDITAQGGTSEQKGAIEATLKDDKKGKTAKDIFNNLNHGHQAKQSGGGGGTLQSGQAQQATASAPSAPVTPHTVQAGGVAPQPTVPAAPAATQIVAVPVQVDAASFLKSTGPSHQANPGMTQPPTSDIQKKAKARAQQYMFDSTLESDGTGSAYKHSTDDNHQEDEHEKHGKHKDKDDD